MTKHKVNLILGCSIAPLITPLILLLLIRTCDIELALAQFGLADIQEAFGPVGMFFFLGAPISYLIMLTLGLPTYFFMKKWKIVTFASVSLGSAMMSSFPLILLSIYNNLIHNLAPANNPILIYLVLAFSGFLVGVTFWFTTGLAKQSKYLV